MTEFAGGVRLRQCLDLGSVEALFPVLKDWPPSELRALLVEIEEYEKRAASELERKHKKAVLQPTVFFSDAAFKRVEDAHQQAAINLIGTLSEIASVAEHYLEMAHGPENDDGD